MCWNHQEILDETGSAENQLRTTHAAMLAQNAGVDTLVLTRLSPQLASPESLERGIEEVTRVYDGRVIVVEEFEWLSP
ncbi:hypothetical protein [Halocatena marina]|uniref:hypothetical protein n=1 Tax=Halocatena marina TaxID=2934937 RepID=UPI00200E2F65|nr:hypothetical protein [Halocatena marina]